LSRPRQHLGCEHTFALDADQEKVQHLVTLRDSRASDVWQESVLDVLLPCVVGGVVRPSGIGSHQLLGVQSMMNERRKEKKKKRQITSPIEIPEEEEKKL